MWYLDMGEIYPTSKTSPLYKVSHWLSESYWIEFVGDLGTLVLFGSATLSVLRIFVA